MKMRLVFPVLLFTTLAVSASPAPAGPAEADPLPVAMKKCNDRLRSSAAYEPLSSGYHLVGKVIQALPRVLTLDEDKFDKPRTDMTLVLNAASTYFETSLGEAMLEDDADTWRKLVVLGLSAGLKFLTEALMMFLMKVHSHPEWRRYQNSLNRIIAWLKGVWDWMRGKDLPGGAMEGVSEDGDRPQPDRDPLSVAANDPKMKPLGDWIAKLADKLRLQQIPTRNDLGDKTLAEERLGDTVARFCALSNDDIDLPPVPTLVLPGATIFGQK